MFPLFGYDRVKLENSKGYSLAINENESYIVKEIFRLYTFENKTYSFIAKYLDNLNLKPRNSDKWSVSSIKDILSNPTYIGKIVWNRRKQRKKTVNGHLVISRPRNEQYLVYDGLHKPIIDTETWNLAEMRKIQNSPKITHNNIIQNPLAGLVYCEKCGKLMQRRPYNNPYKPATLICSNPRCDNVSSKLYIVEDKILEALNLWFNNYKFNYEAINNLSSNNTQLIDFSISSTKKELEKETLKLDKIYYFLEEGIYSNDEFTKRSNITKTNIQNLEKKLEKYNNLLSEKNKLQNEPKSRNIKFNNIIDLYNSLGTAENKNILLKSVISKVTYLKTEKNIRKNSSPTNFELHIYPKICKC